MDWTINPIFILILAVNLIMLVGGMYVWIVKLRVYHKAMIKRLDDWCKKLERVGEYQDKCSRALPEKYVSRKEGESIWGHIEEHDKRISSHGERLAVVEAKS